MNEGEFIAALRSLASAPAARGLADDAAVLELGGETLVVTQDTIVAGIHVRADEDPADVAWKLVAVNLSDLAAKGAAPLGLMVSHMLGDGDARFIEGLGDVLGELGVPLLGGDTTGSGGERRSWSCIALGRATHCPVPDRRGARAGDAIYVTGTLGLAMLGFDEGERNTGSTADLAYRRPWPLLTEGIALAPLVTAMMDVSDGLLLDCQRMAQVSRVRFHLDSDSFPVADPARADACVRWGDDYQLLFTARPNERLPIPATRIGLVEENGPEALLIDGRAPEGDRLGYLHG